MIQLCLFFRINSNFKRFKKIIKVSILAFPNLFYTKSPTSTSLSAVCLVPFRPERHTQPKTLSPIRYLLACCLMFHTEIKMTINLIYCFLLVKTSKCKNCVITGHDRYLN